VAHHEGVWVGTGHSAMYFMQMSHEMQVIFLSSPSLHQTPSSCLQLPFFTQFCITDFPFLQARAWKGGILPQNLRKRCKSVPAMRSVCEPCVVSRATFNVPLMPCYLS
jgi:hypothetical protein